MTADGVKLSLEGAKGGSAETFDAEVVLVAIGRRPFTKNIGLEEVVRISCRKTDQPAVLISISRRRPTHAARPYDPPSKRDQPAERAWERERETAFFVPPVQCPTLPYLFCSCPSLCDIGHPDGQGGPRECGQALLHVGALYPRHWGRHRRAHARTQGMHTRDSLGFSWH